jgi:coproporphyrinogen III oxidase
MDIGALKAYFLDLQDRITSAMSALDGKVFVADEWHKPEATRLASLSTSKKIAHKGR